MWLFYKIIYYKNYYINPLSLDIFANKSLLDITELLEKDGAVIEYIDAQESDVSLIAMYNNDINNFHTHLEKKNHLFFQRYFCGDYDPLNKHEYFLNLCLVWRSP